MLSELGCQMTCVDVDPRALKLCQQRIPSATCILADAGARQIHCQSASFDLLLCVEVAPVIQSDWFVAEAGRLLKDGGIFVGVSWNRSSIRGLFSLLWHRIKHTRSDFYKFSYPEWRRSLVSTNFRLIHEEGFCWGPFGRLSDSRLVPVFVGIERMLELPRLVSFSPWVAFIARKGVARVNG
jgi:SAM-dependent methyltransferase